MSRIHIALVAAGALAALVVPTTATTAPQATMLNGTVGPGFTITLKKGTSKVRSLPAGRYTIRVSDKSKIHDFKLKGAVSKTITTISFVGTKTVTLTLKKGTVTYYCSPHTISMSHSFRVT